ncbi:MAG: hypothetical protein V4591_02235 [Bdellovibrionota bacterium]
MKVDGRNTPVVVSSSNRILQTPVDTSENPTTRNRFGFLNPSLVGSPDHAMPPDTRQPLLPPHKIPPQTLNPTVCPNTSALPSQKPELPAQAPSKLGFFRRCLKFWGAIVDKSDRQELKICPEYLTKKATSVQVLKGVAEVCIKVPPAVCGIALGVVGGLVGGILGTLGSFFLCDSEVAKFGASIGSSLLGAIGFVVGVPLGIVLSVIFAPLGALGRFLRCF